VNVRPRDTEQVAEADLARMLLVTAPEGAIKLEVLEKLSRPLWANVN
jgi:hypothetical protein